MPKDNRNGNRTRRQSRTGRLPQRTSKHIIIVTDGRETEINYINGLKKTITGSGIRITIKQENPPENLVKEVLRLKNLSAASEPESWIFFDRDDVPKFDDIIKEVDLNGDGLINFEEFKNRDFINSLEKLLPEKKKTEYRRQKHLWTANNNNTR